MGLAVGLPIIALANLLRLVAAAYASEHLNAATFTFTHDYLFKVGMILVVVALWASWLQMAGGHESKA